jgi:hypothetical protein
MMYEAVAAGGKAALIMYVYSLLYTVNAVTRGAGTEEIENV